MSMTQADGSADFDDAYQFALQILRQRDPIEPSDVEDAVVKAEQMVAIARPGAAIDAERLRRHITANVNVYRARSTAMDDEEVRDWPNDRAIKWEFWQQYRTLLEQQGRPLAAIDEDDRTTQDILKRIPDPETDGIWDRRGMVVGSVQMGKTSNYTGLICKAADAGYKFIVVLAGLHNSLRSQTQQRLDEGFLGLDSATGPAGNNTSRLMGVGMLPEKHPTAWTFTTSLERGDFKRTVAENIIGRAGGAPMLLVVKKNKSVLENLIKWLLDFNGVMRPDVGRRVVPDLPMLVIDDEADNASVNTKDVDYQVDDSGKVIEETDPSRINQLIRRLLFSCEQSAYVGYTATPFANIFIDSREPSPTIGEDLFPRSFIIRMKPPNNYMGPAEVFGVRAYDDPAGEGRDPLPLVREVDDYEDWLEDGHDKQTVPGPIPSTLRESILSFVLSCAIRSARGDIGAHNSMLVHVTRFVAVQEYVARQVLEELARIRTRLRYGSGDGGWDAGAAIEDLWSRDYEPTMRQMPSEFREESVTWSEVEAELATAVSKIEVRTINGTSGDSLIYRQHPDGLSVIAIGGNKLSRGLTLEGLTVSYYLRASRMYDTLMQMGRWFGYRDGYTDVCRLYTTGELKRSYGQITVANEELLTKFDEMADLGAKPEDFALYVRESPDGLLITAPTKMRNGKTMQLSYSGSISETTTFLKEAGAQKHNAELVLRLIEGQIEGDRRLRRASGNFIWEGVPGTEVAQFFASYRGPDDTKARGMLLSRYVEDRLEDDELTIWTINLVSKQRASDEDSILVPPLAERVGLTMRQEHPSFRNAREGIFIIRRVVSPVDEAADLSDDQRGRAFEESTARYERGDTRADKPPTSAYGPELRRQRSPGRGLLILYLLDPEPAGLAGSVDHMPGFAVSFPDSSRAAAISYRVPNRYWQEEMLLTA